MKSQICLFVVTILCCLSQLTPAVIINNPNYQVETYLRYDAVNLGMGKDFTFDFDGNMYVTHSFGDEARNGSVQKIGADKTITPLRSDLIDPRQIAWGNGGDFGNYLYVTDRRETSTWAHGEVTRIDLTGNKTPFAGGLNQPETLAIDPTGNYNNRLYISNSADDAIMTVGASGGTATRFSEYPDTPGGGVMNSIAFDTTGHYGGGMFAGTRIGGGDMSDAGLFYIHTDGVESRYTDFEHAGAIAFDDTAEQYFGGKMFAAGRDTTDTQWTLYQVNGSYNTEIFGTFEVTPTWTRPDIEFGPDGAMYVMEWDSPNQQVVISRVTVIPEPATLLLLGLGSLILRKKTSGTL